MRVIYYYNRILSIINLKISSNLPVSVTHPAFLSLCECQLYTAFFLSFVCYLLNRVSLCSLCGCDAQIGPKAAVVFHAAEETILGVLDGGCQDSKIFKELTQTGSHLVGSLKYLPDVLYTWLSKGSF